MNKKKTLLLVVLALVLLLAGATVLYDRLSQDAAPDQLAAQETPPTAEEAQDTTFSEETAETPEPVLAPDFTVYDIDGNEVHLSDYASKPVVLNFWASWCGPCQSEMPDFNEAWSELGEDVQFLMINMTDGSRETVESASVFVEAWGYDFPVFYDTQFHAAITYGAYSLPTTYFIDAEGHAIARVVGAIDRETLQRGIDLIFP